ncbi:conserved hypothetical protein [Gammaproteobacteria bacterium]
MSAIAIRKNKHRENIPAQITLHPHGLALTKSKPYYDKEAEQLTAAIARLRVDPQARFEHEAMLKRLTPLLHDQELSDGIPYYDEEFEMPHLLNHTNTIHLLLELFGQVVTRAGLQRLSDNPVWYMDKEGKRKVLYPDYALTASKNLKEITANELLLSLEVVSTLRIEKEKKDSVRMREYNAWNRVPEFVLIYPDPDDDRSVVWYRYHSETKSYQEVMLSDDRRYRSEAIPGLEIEVLKSTEWSEERKIRVYYQGKEVLKAEQERLAKEAAESQAAKERLAKEAAESQAAKELLAKEAAENQAAQERLARETAENQAAQERLAREAAERQVEQLIALLKQSGITK